MAHTTGQILNDRYRIVKLLAQGGFGAVYRAWDISLDRACAIKENLETSPDSQRQFKREAVFLSHLSHPNLPRVTDHFEIPDSGQYLVMDFVEGEDLEQKLQKASGPLPIDDALNWISQVCDALAYLHEQNPPIVHRDIKPANIKITPSGQAVLVDFGIAKEYHPSKATTMGARAVTPGYSSPEQYGKKTTDTRSDVYSLGATAYTMLTGQRPAESVDLLAGIAPPTKSVHELNPLVSTGISAVIKRSMQVNRQERQANANEFKGGLVQAMSQQQDYATVDVVEAGAAGTVAVGAAAAAAATERATSPPTPTYAATGVPAAPVSQPTQPERRFPCLWVGIVGALALIVVGLIAVVLFLTVFDDGISLTGKSDTETADAIAALVTDTPTLAPTDTATNTEVPATETPTEIQPTATEVPTETPEPTATLPPIPMDIVDWDMEHFQTVDSGCRFPNEICWRGTDGDKVMISVESYFIDPNWPSPHLVFWHEYKNPGGTNSDISVQTNYDWIRLNSFQGTSAWKQTTISLKEYVGETVAFRFYMSFGIVEQKVKCDKIVGVTYDCYYVDQVIDSEWAIQKIQLVPNIADIE
jgi:hypothetical protein